MDNKYTDDNPDATETDTEPEEEWDIDDTAHRVKFKPAPEDDTDW